MFRLPVLISGGRLVFILSDSPHDFAASSPNNAWAGHAERADDDMRSAVAPAAVGAAPSCLSVMIIL